MHKNAFLFHQRAARIASLRSFPRPKRHLSPTFIPPQHRVHRRCLSNSPTRRGLVGTVNFPHLGGSHYFHVEIPQPESRNDKEAWFQALEICLPEHLRSSESKPISKTSTSSSRVRRDISLLLIEARRSASIDLLGYLGPVKGRWDIVTWVVQTIAREGLPSDLLLLPHDGAMRLENPRGVPLERLLQKPLSPKLPHNLSPIQLTLDQVTVQSDPRFYDTRLQRGALGQIWQSLGNMIIESAENAREEQRLMPHVLTLLATLHHHDIVPESVYRYLPAKDAWSVYQPPLLYTLSDTIVTALGEAAWNAHAAVANNKDNGNTSSSLLGLKTPEIPKLPGLRSEVWLELVLWSCLHGPWVDEGASLLKRLATDKTTANWSLICWQNMVENHRTEQETFRWQDALDLLQGHPLGRLHPTSNEKVQIQVLKTVSSEVVCAYVDALLSRIHVGVGERGVHFRELLSCVQSLKKMLARQNLGLGFATWDAIVQRFLESGGIWIERDPALAMEVLQLAEPYGRELEASNVPSTPHETTHSLPYFFSPSGLPLGILHRCLYAQCERGSIGGTMETLKAIQDFTEINQRRSIEQFFRDLKQDGEAAPSRFQFNNGLAAAEYPGFFMQVPIYVLDKFLDIATDISDPEFQHWILHSKDVDGPLVPESMYEEAGLAPALVRFATATNNKDLLEKVMTVASRIGEDDQVMIPPSISNALMETLIERRRWGSIERIANSEDSGSNQRAWNISILPTLIREILRIQVETKTSTMDSPPLARVVRLLEHLVHTHIYTKQHANNPDILFTHLTLFASIDEQCAAFCMQLGVLPRRSLRCKLYPDSFTKILQGVLESRGFQAGRKLWETWCFSSDRLQVFQLEGGLHVIPRRRQRRNLRFSRAEQRVVLGYLPNGPAEVAPRVQPNLHAVRLLLQSFMVMAEDGHGQGKLNGDEHDEIRMWIARYVQALALRKDTREKSVAELSAIMEDAGLV